MADTAPVFCWTELGANEARSLSGFYAEVFGWAPEFERSESPTGRSVGYATLKAGDVNVGGLYELDEHDPRMPSWLPYVDVEDTDSLTRKADALGGKILMDPVDVLTYGRLAIVEDPTEAAFALWQRRAPRAFQIGPGKSPTHGFALMTADRDRAARFYASLLGWDRREGEDVDAIVCGDRRIARFMDVPDAGDKSYAQWLTHFAVDDCEATCRLIEKFDGVVCEGPKEVPGVGCFALVKDAQHALFAIIKRRRKPEQHGRG